MFSQGFDGGLVASGLLMAIVFASILSILVYYAKTGAVPVPSSAEESRTAVRLLREAAIKPGSLVYELGCGWASLTLEIARAFPEAQVVGFELSPLPYLVARMRTRRNRRIRIIRRNFLQESLDEADAVTTYLGIKSMAELSPHLDRTLRQGTPVVSLCFLFRDRKPVRVEQLRVLRGEAALYLWPGRG